MLIAVVESFGHDTTATMLFPAVTLESDPELVVNAAFWMKDDTIYLQAAGTLMVIVKLTFVPVWMAVLPMMTSVPEVPTVRSATATPPDVAQRANVAVPDAVGA